MGTLWGHELALPTNQLRVGKGLSRFRECSPEVHRARRTLAYKRCCVSASPAKEAARGR